MFFLSRIIQIEGRHSFHSLLNFSPAEYPETTVLTFA